jgi:hypothetical protein
MTVRNKNVCIVFAVVTAAALIATVGVETIGGQTVTSTSSSGAARVVLGTPTSHFVTDTFGTVTDKWVLYQVIPVTVYGPTSTTFSLSTPNLPSQTWVHFGSSSVVTSATGTDTTITIMGAIASPGPGQSQDFTVQASDSAMTVNSTIQVATGSEGSPLMVLSGSPSEQLLPSTVDGLPSNASTPVSIPMVYDPSSPSTEPSTLAVSLDVLGIVVNGSVESVPSSMSFDFSNATFTLGQYQPAFISIHESNTVDLSVASPPQQYVVAIGETVNGVQSTQDVTMTIAPPFQSAPP